MAIGSNFTDDEPVSNTCGDIDSILKELRTHNNGLCDSCEPVDVSGELEDLRTANSTLRDWGNHWVKKYQDLEKEKDDEIKELQSKIDEQKDQIYDLKKEVESLQKEIDDFEE